MFAKSLVRKVVRCAATTLQLVQLSPPERSLILGGERFETPPAKHGGLRSNSRKKRMISPSSPRSTSRSCAETVLRPHSSSTPATFLMFDSAGRLFAFARSRITALWASITTLISRRIIFP